MTKNNQEIAQEIQTKVGFYLVGLVFTVLAVAIETAKFEGTILTSLFELLGWVSLFVSGVFGILRLEAAPYVYALFHLRDARSNSGDENSTLRLTNTIDLENKKIIRYYAIHKWLLVIGFACLIVSRGLTPFLKVIVHIHELF